MCPVCIATAALLVSGAGSTGGLAGLAARKILRRGAASKVPVLNSSK